MDLPLDGLAPHRLTIETRRARSMQHAAEVEVVALQHVEVVDVLVVLAGGEVGASQRRR